MFLYKKIICAKNNDICLFHKNHICKIIPVSIALCTSTTFLACICIWYSLCSKCSGNTNYAGCTAVSLYCIYLQCTRARVLNPVGTRVSSVQMTLFGRLSFFPFLHLLNLFGAIHKSKIQGVFQTEYELPFTVNMTFHYWDYNQLVILWLDYRVKLIGQLQPIVVDLNSAKSYFYCIYLQCLQSISLFIQSHTFLIKCCLWISPTNSEPSFLYSSCLTLGM